jgi:ADP-ribose pyrophosphatase YjhB (NUDIX family)
MASFSGRRVAGETLSDQGFPLTQTEKRLDEVNCAGAVVRDPQGRVLLVRRANEPSRGSWSLPGGRIEPGESPRETVVREVREETGLDVSVGDVLGIVDFGPYTVADFGCTLVSGTPVAGDDALDVRWCARDDVATLPTSPGLLAYLDAWGVF